MVNDNFSIQALVIHQYPRGGHWDVVTSDKRIFCLAIAHHGGTHSSS